jgi:competence protein ComEC
MRFSPIPVWKEAPFLRFLIPFAAGILVQWHSKFGEMTGCLGTIISCILLLLFSLKSLTSKFKSYWFSGILLNCSFFFAGIMLAFFKDGSNNPLSIARVYLDGSLIVARFEEPPSEKFKSFKTLASVQAIQTKDFLLFPKSHIIIYLEKDSLINIYRAGKSALAYGTQIVFKKKLQPIQNTGNPGGFDYRRYCSFKKIYYQVYLKAGDYKILPAKNKNSFRQFLYTTRSSIINILRNYIPGDKESGLAEALLIGYTDDLDKNLVQSYSNTGVVHIIAISGLHVGLIYWVLACILDPLKKNRSVRFLKPILIIAGLWMFCFLAGGSPSVLRSAVMFTFIVLSQGISRKISIYNSLAASAFVLLCYNPFWLWDTGFQLSYAAVLSIIIFMKPFYNCLFIQNRILDTVWKLNAVTLSAQVFTIPVCLYYFHQFPNFFLIANLIAVPLSSIILIVELFLCVGILFPVVADKIGWLLYWLIRLMNSCIERIDKLPFSVVDNIQMSFSQLILLYVIIINFSIWILQRKKLAFTGAIAGVFIFGLMRIHSLWIVKNQHKLIVYHIPQHQAIDFIEGSNYLFKGDSDLIEDDFLQRFYLKSSRISNHVTQSDSLANLVHCGGFYVFKSKKIMIIEKPLIKITPDRKIDADIIIISKSPKLGISDIHNIFTCKQIILDASNPGWKIQKWLAECNELNIPCYSVPDKGAFVMIMN